MPPPLLPRPTGGVDRHITRPENTSVIIAAIMNWGVAEQHGPGPARGWVSSQQTTLQEDPQPQASSVTGGIIHRLPTLSSDLHKATHMDSGHERLHPAGDGPLPTQSKSKAFLGLGEALGILPLRGNAAEWGAPRWTLWGRRGARNTEAGRLPATGFESQL